MWCDCVGFFRKAGLFLTLSFLSGIGITRGAEPPNILFAFADDWGRHAGAYGIGLAEKPDL
jgi:hypothetical protein